VPETVQLDFSRSLYDLDAVQAAAVAYAELATFEVESTESQVTVRMADPHPDVPDLVDHFTNHVLYATVTGRRRSAEGVA
jgi:hypothetical protein